MQPADHVDLRDPEFQPRARLFHDLVDAHLKGVRLALFRAERAELTREDAVVRVIDVLVVDVGRDVPVFALAQDVGDRAQAVEIIRTVKPQRLVIRHPLTGDDLVENGAQGRSEEAGGHA